MAANYTVAVDEEVRAVLNLSTFTATTVQLPDEQLSRDLYQRVNKVLEAAGGKWNRRTRVHDFERDPREVLGAALSAGSITDQKKAAQQFFTPGPLAERMCKAAGIGPGTLVLEPSAGRGAIADAAKAMGGTVWCCIESDEALADFLREVKGYPTLWMDFLKYPAPELRIYDAVVMNPPFANGQDIAHVRHAYDFLRPGGRLVAIINAGVSHNTSAKHAKFRAWLEAVGATVEVLPAESFREAGTSVSTLMVTIVRP